MELVEGLVALRLRNPPQNMLEVTPTVTTSATAILWGLSLKYINLFQKKVPDQTKYQYILKYI